MIETKMKTSNTSNWRMVLRIKMTMTRITKMGAM